MSTAYKIVARYPMERQLQWKKKIYATQEDFNKYAPDLISRWGAWHNIEIYVMDVDDKWKLLRFVESQCNLCCANCDECDTYSNRIDS